MLYIDYIEQLTDYLVVVRNSRLNESVQGLIDNDSFSYSLGAQLSESQVAGSIEGALKGVASSAVDYASKFAGGLGGHISNFGNGLINNNFKTVLSTYKGYNGSDDISFQVSMHIFPNRLDNGDFPSIIEKIAKFTQPNTKDNYLLHSYLYDPKSTLGLSVGKDPFKGQLIHVSIGKWFLATGLFCSGNTPSYSKYVDGDGKPLYMEWSATFTPYKVLNAEEISAWHLL